MHYPVNVFTGKVREYDGSRPSAIAKIQVDGELTLTDLGLAGDEQAEKKIHSARSGPPWIFFSACSSPANPRSVSVSSPST